MNEYSEHLELMERAALAAGAHLIAARKSPDKIVVHLKPDNSIVMNLDLECQDTIRAVLAKKLTIVSEEDDASHALVERKGDYFVIDPIDGTASCKRFLHQEGGQIGFGPLVGLVIQGKLTAATYYNVPNRTLYSALLGKGAYALQVLPDSNSKLPKFEERRALKIAQNRTLQESGMLFFPGSIEEFQVVLYLRANNLIENTYRLGGFANDCCRIAEDFEQVQIQCRVKAWDFSAALIAKEAGVSLVLDPFGTRVDFEDWNVSSVNSTLAIHPANKKEFLRAIDQSRNK